MYGQRDSTFMPNLIKKNKTTNRDVNVKIIIIAGLALVLLIPAFMLGSLISEREDRKESVINEISSKWGSPQTVGGPVISVPFRVSSKDDKGRVTIETNYIHFLPNVLNVQAELVPEIRYRGIYEAVLYSGKINIVALFSPIDFSGLGVSRSKIVKSGAILSLGITDMIGIRDQVKLRVNGKQRSFEPGIKTTQVLLSGVSSSLSKMSGPLKVEITIDLNGSRSLQFLPVGKNTKVKMTSAWDSPSFHGAFLPVERDVTENGFSANWNVLHLNRNYPQRWVGERFDIQPSAFGVKLHQSVDTYRKSMRMSKYAIMFIAFTFVAFFLSEILYSRPFHPVQYLLIGFALLIFYTLLLSFSEHVWFGFAYFISSTAIVALISLYSYGILVNKLFSSAVAGLLVILYSYMYIVLQLEDFALLMGSVGLFVVLSAIMYITRKIDWYAIGISTNPVKKEK